MSTPTSLSSAWTRCGSWSCVEGVELRNLGGLVPALYREREPVRHPALSKLGLDLGRVPFPVGEVAVLSPHARRERAPAGCARSEVGHPLDHAPVDGVPHG